MTNKGGLKVSLLDISPHNKAILEFFFAGAGSRLFKVVPKSDADAYIVDFDHPNAKQNWEKINKEAHKPTMAMAFYEVEIENTIWLPKPLSTQALIQAADKVHHLLKDTAKNDVAPTTKKISLKESLAKMPSTEGVVTPFDISKKTVNKTKPKLIKTPPVKAPFKPKKLVATLEEEKNKEDKKPAASVTNKAKPEKTTTEANKKTNKPAISLEEKQKRWEKLCGVAEDIKNPQTWKSEVTLYTPENYLISSLQDALRLAIQSQQIVQIKYQTTTIYFIPKTLQAYCNISITSDDFEKLCKTPVKKTDVVISIANEREVERVNNLLSEKPENLYDLEGFIWTSMLLTSAGKLHRNVDIKKRIMLRHWPNFTRIETFPHVIRISALWSNDAFNMLEIAHNLNIPQRYVFAFYNAACVLGLMEHNPDKLKTRMQHTQKKEPNKNRGLFSRLLNRLLG